MYELTEGNLEKLQTIQILDFAACTQRFADAVNRDIGVTSQGTLEFRSGWQYDVRQKRLPLPYYRR